MDYWVFRNQTIERFFPNDYQFSGYGDISVIPNKMDGYIWFYLLPIMYDQSALSQELSNYSLSFNYVLERINPNTIVIALTIDVLYPVTFIEENDELQKAIYTYNNSLYEATHAHPNLKVIDISNFTKQFSTVDLLDWKYFFISQMGMNPRISRTFSEWWNRKLKSIAFNRKKCIVLDLDNTLWGGIIGEDGVSGIKLGGDYPGNAFKLFQAGLLELKKSGIILTVCSKNNEKDVLELWDNHPECILRKEHFAAYRINWTDKATNIRELAQDLNIGLDSMVFIDDNPTERELIKQTLPMVVVPSFPEQPYEIPVFFKSLVDNYFIAYSVTTEDKEKTEQYLANANRQKALQSFSNFDDYLISLDIQLFIENANAFNIDRIAQMTQKTNQFNLTTKRYDSSQLRVFLSANWKIWCLSVSDNFGDSGITACMIMDGTRIDTFLLSCRILGKGIEFAFLKTILSSLKASGMQFVTAQFVPTQKNTQVADFWDKCGFTRTNVTDNGTVYYRLDLSTANLTVQDYYHIKTQ